MRKKALQRRIKIFLPILFVTILAIGILTYTNLWLSSKALEDQINEASLKSVQNIAGSFEDALRQLQNELSEIYFEEDFIRNMGEEEPYERLREAYISLARSFATEHFPTERRVDAFYIYTAKHEIISTYRRANTPVYRYPSDIYAPRDDVDYNTEIIREYIGSDRSAMLVSGYYNPYRQRDVVRVVYKLYVENRSRLVGYLVCDLDDRPFLDEITSDTYYEDQIIYMEPLGDKIVLSVGEPEEQQMAELSAVSQQISELSYPLSEGEFSISAEEPVFTELLPQYGLTFYSMLPESILRDRQRSFATTVFILTLVLIAALLVVVWLMVGYYDQKYALLQKNADFRALQSQINPHFLYNTLGMMSSIARRAHCPEVSDLSLALSDIFRYSMSVKEDSVRLQEEVEHLRNYLYVMTTRMQNEITAEVRIAPAHMGLRLPRITLQPIVENAILHGLAEVRGEKRLAVFSDEREGKVIVTVRDNGTGMDAEKINRWLEETGGEESGTSVGMKNVHLRLRYFYGSGYGLHVESDESGSRVEIILKKES